MALTKRAARMRAYFSAPPVELLQRWAKAADGRIILDNPDVFFSEAVETACTKLPSERLGSRVPWDRPEALFPLRNLMLGVSVEDRPRLGRLDDLRARHRALREAGWREPHPRWRSLRPVAHADPREEGKRARGAARGSSGKGVVFAMMTDQLEMFATPPSVEATPQDGFDAAGAALRLRVCHEWTFCSGAKMSYAVVARDPWVSYEKGGRDLDAFDRKINRRAKRPTREERDAEFEREFVWFVWCYKVSHVEVHVAVLAPHGDVLHLTREIATESARNFALIFDTPAEAVVRWVLTGQVTP